MLASKQISYKYPSVDKLSFPDINCAKGEHTLLLGPSGCGKTTLLQILAGLRIPATGDVIINDIKINSLSNSELDNFRGKNIGLIFQTSHFIKSLDVVENIAIAQSFSGQNVDINKIKKLLDRLDLSEKYHKKAFELSQGEQQRVAIARAIINNPKIILADEPTSALDDLNTDRVLKLIIEYAEMVNATVIVVTHDNRLKAKFSNRIEL